MIRPVPAFLAGLLALAVAVSACALPSDNEAHVVSNSRVEELTQLPSTTSTTVVGETRERTLFFFDGDRLVGEARSLPANVTVAEVLNALTDGSKADLRNAVPPGVNIESTSLADDGTLTIELEGELLYGVEGNELTRAVAQIVVTATHLQDDIKQVKFVIDDEVQRVPAGEESADTKDPVDECDYRQFYPQAVCPPTTTTSLRDSGS